MNMNIKQDAVDILNGLIGDICIAVEVLRDYETGVYPNRDGWYRKGILRLCLQSIFLNCAKYTEFCREYGFVLTECCPELKKTGNIVKGELEKRGVNAFRSKYIAHNRCDKTKKPFTSEQVDEYVANILGGNGLEPFLDFLLPDNPKKFEKLDYFTGFMEIVRDKIHQKL